MSTGAPARDHGLTRRRFLQGSAAGIAIATLPHARLLAAEAEGLPLPADPLLHLVKRTSFGPTPETLARARRLGAAAFVDEQLDPLRLDDTACAQALTGHPSVTITNVGARSAYGDATTSLAKDLGAATCVRQSFSSRQLFEVMVDFWSNHLNVYSWEPPEVWYRPAEDREVIRAHALGRFADLLLASARSPAMLCSLDNAWSSASNPNENYGRELLELHTVGVDGGYGEQDVRQAALALTGWSVDFDRTHEYRYRPTWHHTGPLQVMGWSWPAHDALSGEEAGRSLIEWLARRPATARHLARKLCVRFVDDQPPETLVASAAQVYLDHDTAIAPVLRHVLTSAAFGQSIGAKTRRPLEALGAMVRATGVAHLPGPTGGESLRARAHAMGQGPFSWEQPDGYPDDSAAWLNPGGLLERWKAAQQAAYGFNGLSRPDPAALAGGPLRPLAAGELVDALCERLLFQRAAPAHRLALLDWLRKGETEPVTDQELAGRGRGLVALILSSAYLQLR